MPIKKSGVVWTVPATLLTVGLFFAVWCIGGVKPAGARALGPQGAARPIMAPQSQDLSAGSTFTVTTASLKGPSLLQASAAVAPTIPIKAASDVPQLILYVVKPGDNLTKIAKRHGTTVKAIRAVNDLQADRIAVGQKIRIPVVADGRPTAPAPA